jgi:hypothetical protein
LSGGTADIPNPRLRSPGIGRGSVRVGGEGE